MYVALAGEDTRQTLDQTIQNTSADSISKSTPQGHSQAWLFCLLVLSQEKNVERHSEANETADPEL